MKGINDTTKREEVVDIFKRGKFELLALTKTKLKGEGEVSWVEVNVISSGIQKMERAREGVAVLLVDVWHSAVVKDGCVSPRLYFSVLNSSFQGLKFLWWWGTAPMKQRVESAREVYGSVRAGGRTQRACDGATR